MVLGFVIDPSANAILDPQKMFQAVQNPPTHLQNVLNFGFGFVDSLLEKEEKIMQENTTTSC